jgi:DNA topoisomerase III
VDSNGEPDNVKKGDCFKCGKSGHWSNNCPNNGADAKGKNSYRKKSVGNKNKKANYKKGGKDNKKNGKTIKENSNYGDTGNGYKPDL